MIREKFRVGLFVKCPISDKKKNSYLYESDLPKKYIDKDAIEYIFEGKRTPAENQPFKLPLNNNEKVKKLYPVKYILQTEVIDEVD